MPPSIFGSPGSSKQTPTPAATEPPAGTLDQSLSNPNIPLMGIHVARQNALAKEVTELRIALTKARDELDAAKSAHSPSAIRKIMGKPTISGLTKTFQKLKTETMEVNDRWVRLQEHREELPYQVGVTEAMLGEVDVGMKEVEKVVVLVARWMEEAEQKLQRRLGPETLITRPPMYD